MANGVKHIFIDESGDLGKVGSRYFIIAALCTNKPELIYRCIKKIRERKLKKKLRDITELKGNNSSDIIRRAVLQKLMKCDCEIHIITLDKEKVYNYLFEHKDKLYNFVAGILFDHLQDSTNHFLNVIIDKKDKKSILREDFNNYIKHKARWNVQIDIVHMESETNKGLQMVDFVAWSVHRKYNHQDDSFYKIIEPKITSIKNMFS